MGYPPGPPNVPGPGVVPLWLAVTLAVVSLILLARGFGVGRRDAFAEATAERTDPTVMLRLLQLLTAVAVYAFVMPLLGFIVSTTMLSLIALRVFGHRNVLHAVAYSLASSFVLYLVFQKLMNVPLPSGWLG